MAFRGAKPKPSHLLLIDGTRNVTRHGTEQEIRDAVDVAKRQFGDLEKPAWLTGEAESAWRRYITPAAWLDRSREPAAIAFCELWQEFCGAPKDFPSSKHGQMRAYMSELGLTDERNRVLDGQDEESDEFFAN